MNSVKNIGSTTVVTSPNKGSTVHIPSSVHNNGLKRLFSSKKFKKLPKGREVVKEGNVVILSPMKLQYVPAYQVFMFPVNQDGKILHFKCRKVTNKKVRVLDMERFYDCVPSCEVLVYKNFSYSFTIKTSNMATKKAAPKKAAPKARGKAVKKAEGGPGKIEQIIALHKQGLSNKEIVEKGFNYTTVSIQVSKFKRAKEAAKGAKKKAAA